MNVDELINHCETALAEDWQYVYGAKRQVLTRQQIQNLRNLYGNNVWVSDLTKAGHVCCDCSGLISSATGVLRGSLNYKNTASEVLPISQRTSDMRGWGVWMNGHIGVYDGNNGYYAMDGSARNMKHYPLSMNRFTHIIKLCDIDYGSGSNPQSADEKKTPNYNLILDEEMEIIATIESEENQMQMIFSFDGAKGNYYFDGQQIKVLKTTDEQIAIEDLYRRNTMYTLSNGQTYCREIPHVVYNSSCRLDKCLADVIAREPIIHDRWGI